jgi:hypothetical protein
MILLIIEGVPDFDSSFTSLTSEALFSSSLYSSYSKFSFSNSSLKKKPNTSAVRDDKSLAICINPRFNFA